MPLGNTDDWIVSDSEDEDSLLLERIQQPTAADKTCTDRDADSFMASKVSSVETFTSNILPRPDAPESSHISSFTHQFPNITTTSALSSGFPSNGISNISKAFGLRPRPRPAYKGSKVISDGSDSPAIQTPSSDHILPPTIVIDHHINSHVLDAALEDYSQDIAERTKMRSRKAAKKTALPSTDVIDISSEDELALKPVQKATSNPRSRPKPRPVKRVKHTHPEEDDMPPPSDPNTIPMANSSFHLPPSDFPLSSLGRESSPSLGRAVIPAPDSSSLASPVQQRKRMHTDSTAPTGVRIDDALDDSMDIDDSSKMPPPPSPPPFFAASSIPQTPSTGGSSSTKPSEKPKKATKRGKNIAADVDNPPAKMKARGKKKAIAEVVIESRKDMATGEEDGGDAIHNSNSSRLPVSEKEDAIAPPKKRKGKEGGRSKAKKGEDKTPSELVHKKASKRGVIVSDEEEEPVYSFLKAPASIAGNEPHQALVREDGGTMDIEGGKAKVVQPETPVRSKENVHLPSPNDSRVDDETPTVPAEDPPSSSSTFARRYTFARPSKSTPMQELIRRAASHPTSPFSSASPAAHSPLAKASKSALRRIAPLHPNRRTPPPPPPRPPPPKKSKKMLDLEEKWEMELEDTVEGWWALTDDERKEWRRAKRDKELGFDD
ncbi:hypothetical protein BV25DRAFT_1919188 [Artomyces pyxidatus]|uniref:Uncharacterized protein n=1 Tax=Artomyces pyxidatus TaxID=48021 RepID=A0ACB8SR48_9AGAM|nr:hypothetical protein BV25DRAFT_1919188 [Artomyces pyxidatus]